MRGTEPVGVDTIWPAREGCVAVCVAVAETEEAADAEAGVGFAAAAAVDVEVDVALVADAAGALGTASGCDMGVSYLIW